MPTLTSQYDVINKIKFVAVYLRKSRGTGDMEVDLEKHYTKIKEYCKEFKWKFVVYEEIASGSDITNRPEMQKLLNDVSNDMYDAVFVFDIDRLSRGGSSDQERIFSTFRNTNTLIVSANPFKIYNLNDESDDMMIDMFGFIGKMEYKQIRKRMLTGKKIGLNMGKWTNGNPPFGYRYNRTSDPDKKGKLIVDKEEAKIVREAVDKYLNGYSTIDIAWDFNKRKIPSPGGSRWNAVTITRIFKSKIYQGHMVGNKSEGNRNKKRSDTSKPFRPLPENEWIVIQNCHEQLITEEEYELIMKMLKDNTKKRFRNKINTFTGIIKCNICGNIMHHKTLHNKDGLAACECGNHGGTIDIIEESIYQSAIQLRDRLKQIKVEEVESQRENQLLKEIESLEKQLVKQDTALERIEEMYEEGEYDKPKYQMKKKKREEEKWRLENELKKLRKQLSSVDSQNNKERISKIDQFINDIKKDNNSEQKNRIYKSLISEILWEKKTNEKVNITINFL
ncbi:recombinase family protein [Neobacillus sp. YIM B02564]|uniref:Recombinase family protein n=1 Tax=Neobacillus paridis TaxID=2803862 RepID=A0ABS1TII6_9BACI|nr:recombinase family protein [Neobacillus paridis]MBL4951125.1 recombinase family protein [Neobacillus paridis]